MDWYAAEPLAEVDPQRALAFGLSCGKSMPQLREFMLRRLASIDSPEVLAALAGGLAKSNDADEQLALLDGLRRALRGRRLVKPPANWSTAYQHVLTSPSQTVRDAATGLSVTFGDAAAMESFRKLAASPEASIETRRTALDALLGAKDPQLVPELQTLLEDPNMRDLRCPGWRCTTIQRRPSCCSKLTHSGHPQRSEPPWRRFVPGRPTAWRCSRR